MAVEPSNFTYILWNFLAGLAVPVADLPMLTYLQKSVPDEFRGRVNSVVSMISMGVMPIGFVLAGTIVEQFGVWWGFVGMGILMTTACLLGLLLPKFRNVRMPEDHEVAPPTASAQPA